MSLGSWFKNLLFEKEEGKEKTEESSEEDSNAINGVKEKTKNYDYNVKIFDLVKKEDVNNITNYIVQDKALALVKMHKFIGNKDDVKYVLNELKQTCDNCNSKIVGLTNNMYFITKNSINIERENSNPLS